MEEYVEKSIRDRTCSKCKNTIKKNEPHFSFGYKDGNWQKKLNLCRDCIYNIYLKLP